jgi:EAL domain-containing protein (putative c-di-GMP-specific phosphodiesterase class I)
LAHIKPDFVKFDMDLIRNVHRDRFKDCVARKLIELACELGVKTVVEGVETYDEWKWARDHGADFSQGYLFARPAPDPPRPIFPRDRALVPAGGPIIIAGAIDESTTHSQIHGASDAVNGMPNLE